MFSTCTNVYSQISATMSNPESIPFRVIQPRKIRFKILKKRGTKTFDKTLELHCSRLSWMGVLPFWANFIKRFVYIDKAWLEYQTYRNDWIINAAEFHIYIAIAVKWRLGKPFAPLRCGKKETYEIGQTK